MADKIYYNQAETLEKLGCTEPRLREMVRAGRLREFRDAGKLTYRVDEVDKLLKEGLDASGSSHASGGRDASEESGEISLADTGDFAQPDDSGEGKSDELGGTRRGGSSLLGDSDAPIELADDTGAPIRQGKEPSGGSTLGGSGLEGASGADETPVGLSESGMSVRALEDSDSGGGSGLAGLTGSGSGELKLEDTGSGSGEVALSDSGSGSSAGAKGDVLSLDEVDKDAVEGMKKDDTVITNIGISVFDDDDLEIAADPMAKTMLTGGDEHLGLDGSGGGSGLLELTRESDDTSLGAELLEGIDMGDTAETVSPTAADTAPTGEPVEDDMAEVGGEPAFAVAPVQVVGGVVEPVSPAFAALLMAATLVMALAGAFGIASTLDVWPSYLAALSEQFWAFLAGSVGVGSLFALVGWFMGRQATAPKKPRTGKDKNAKKGKGKGAGAKGSA